MKYGTTTDRRLRKREPCPLKLQGSLWADNGGRKEEKQG